MQLSNLYGIRIAGAGLSWPKDILGESAQLDNAGAYAALLGPDWEQYLGDKGLDKSKPKEIFGVEERGWTRGTDKGSLELSIDAVEKALKVAGIDSSQVDCIFSATCTPHQITSTLSGKIAKSLGSTAMSIDIRAGGAAGLDAMATAALYHQQGCKVSVVVTAEVASQYMGDHDLGNGLLFGDGAAAFVLVTDSSAKEAGLVGAIMGNADWQGKAFTVPTRIPPLKTVNPDDFFFQTPDKTYRKCLADTWDNTSKVLREYYPQECKQLTAMLPYAVTKDQVLAAVEPFNVDCEASLNLLAEHGCIGCASPMASLAMHWLNQHNQGNDQTGDVLGSMAVAGGISWAALLWRL